MEHQPFQRVDAACSNRHRWLGRGSRHDDYPPPSGFGCRPYDGLALAGESASFTAVSVTAAIWFVVVQWLASALGGYLTGRLRTKWAGMHTDEVFFRDTAHGFLSWALATVVVAGLAGSAFTSLAGTGVQAASTVAATATVAGSAAAANSDASPDAATGHFTDLLLRPQDLTT